MLSASHGKAFRLALGLIICLCHNGAITIVPLRIHFGLRGSCRIKKCVATLQIERLHFFKKSEEGRMVEIYRIYSCKGRNPNLAASNVGKNE